MSRPPKVTRRIGSKVFLTSKFREELAKHRKGTLEPSLSVRKRLCEGKERWYSYLGDSYRYGDVWINELGSKPKNFLLSLKKSNPQIMVVGPHYGYDILEMKKDLKKSGINPEVDVFGLMETIRPSVRPEVRRDFSQGVALETVGSDPHKYPKLVRSMKGKYDLVMAAGSAGLHTNHPTHNCFFMALMLAPGGEAYIQIRPLREPKKHYDLEDKKTFPHLNALFPKFVDSYNRQNGTDLEFVLTPIKFGEHNIYVKIERIK
jgi:hypothetical protein